MSAAATYEGVLRDAALADGRVVVLTAENRAPIRGLPAALGPRFVDFGICEQTMVGAAAGLALRGRVPVAHALATFLTMRPFEFVRTDIGIPGLPVKLVGWVPGVLSEANGPTHQALEDVALMRGIPGMRVFSPGDSADLLAGLPAVIADPSPWYVRFNSRLPAVEHEPFAIGRAERLLPPGEVEVLVHGALLPEALESARTLRASGLDVGLLNLRTLVPLDVPAVADVALRARLVVVVEDHFEVGGLTSILAELCLARRLAPEVLSLSFPARWFRPALLPDVLAVEGLTADAIAGRIRNAFERRTR
ncbi:MAG: transketolase family protein [Thermoanaerobaculia bacterium]